MVGRICPEGNWARIMELVSQGFTGQEIADELGLSIHTIKTHLKDIFKRLRAANSPHAVRRAIEEGWIVLKDVEVGQFPSAPMLLNDIEEAVRNVLSKHYAARR